MESLHASVQSWIMEEENDLPLTYWEVVHEYQESTDPTSLSDKILAVLSEVKNL